ncbi:MAG TPA: hypothetical protein VE871_10540 [Longimicrobium sp.]|nr:hypothetical protein [Longimicrobium sp.]
MTLPNARRRLALACMTPLLLTVACWDDGTSPRDYTPLVCAGGTGASASSTIGPAGGTVTVNGNSLIVPAGALSSAVTFRITERGDRSVGVEVQPHGTQFSKDATLALSYARCGNLAGYKDFRIVEVDSGTTRVLRTLPSQVDSATRTVRTTRLNHLSGYLIGSNRSSEE